MHARIGSASVRKFQEQLGVAHWWPDQEKGGQISQRSQKLSESSADLTQSNKTKQNEEELFTQTPCR